MAEIPTFVNDVTVHPGQTPEASPGAMSAAGQALERGGEQISNTIDAFSQRYADARRSMDAANTIADLDQKLGDANFRWSKTPDRVAAIAGFNAEAAQLRQKALGSITDPLVGPLVAREFDAHAAQLSIATGQDAFKLESKTQIANVDQNLFNYAQAAATAPNDVVRAKITDNAIGMIRVAVAGGWMDPADGKMREINFGSQIQEVRARQLMNDALSTQDPNKAQALERAISDPTNFPGMLPEAREVMARRIETMANTLAIRSAAQLAHADATADRNMKRAQGRTEATVLAMIDGGKPVDEATLDSLAISGQISAGGLEAAHSALDRRANGSNDASTVVRLWHAVDAGTAKPDDIYSAISGHQLNSSTAAELVRAIDAKSASGSPAEKGAFSILKTAMNGQAIEQGTFGGDKGPAVAAWAQAQGDWHARVTIGHEDPTNVLNDLMAKYAHATKPTWLPSPKFGAVQSYADLQTVARETQAALRSGQLSAADAEAQGQLLQKYAKYYRAPPPKPARPALAAPQ